VHCKNLPNPAASSSNPHDLAVDPLPQRRTAGYERQVPIDDGGELEEEEGGNGGEDREEEQEEHFLAPEWRRPNL